MMVYAQLYDLGMDLLFQVECEKPKSCAVIYTQSPILSRPILPAPQAERQREIARRIENGDPLMAPIFESRAAMRRWREEMLRT